MKRAHDQLIEQLRYGHKVQEKQYFLSEPNATEP